MTEVIEQTENKKGYKKTKLGWIPEDWEVVKSGKLFHNYSKKNNKQEELLSVTQDKGVIPRLMVEARIAMPEGSTSSYKLVEKGDFVISLRSFQGGIEYSEYRGVVSPAYTILKRNLAISDGYYKQWFKSSEFIARLGVAIIGIRDGKQISYEDFSMLPICYPPLKEQEKIAEILSAWDDGIETLEKLIEQKEIFHKALMKNLLIGKIRLSGYNSKWTHSKFNSIFERITRKNEELNSNILTISAQNGLISQKDFYNKYKGLQFTGFVKDLQQELLGTIMIVPITIGSGIRMKIQEAAKMGIPVITTTVGVEGIPFENRKECIIEDEPEKFAEAILKLNSIQDQQILANAAYKKITEIFGFEALRQSRLPIYKKLANG